MTDRAPQEGKIWTAPAERVHIQQLHWGVVALVIVCTSVLGALHIISGTSVASLFSLIAGHAATSAAHKLSSRG